MFEQIVLKPILEVYGTTISSTGMSLPQLPNGAVKATIQCDTKAMRIRFSATTNVTGGAGGGLYLATNTHYTFEGWDALYRARIISDDLAAGFINVVYWGAEQVS